MPHADRGKAWEEILTRTFTVMSDQGSTVVKTDPPVKAYKYTKKNRFEGCFLAPGMCDYEGGHAGRPVCIEAKEVAEGGRFYFKSRLGENQRTRMHKTAAMRGITGILMRWPYQGDPGNDRMAWIPWCAVFDMLNAGFKGFSPPQVYEHAMCSSLEYQVGPGGLIVRNLPTVILSGVQP